MVVLHSCSQFLLYPFTSLCCYREYLLSPATTRDFARWLLRFQELCSPVHDHLCFCHDFSVKFYPPLCINQTAAFTNHFANHGNHRSCWDWCFISYFYLTGNYSEPTTHTSLSTYLIQQGRNNTPVGYSLPALKLSTYRHPRLSTSSFWIKGKLGLQSDLIFLATDKTAMIINNLHHGSRTTVAEEQS